MLNISCSNLPPQAQRLSSPIRAHWSIENQVHWVLDVVFNEDQSSVRKDNAPENMALIRHIALNMLNNAKKYLKMWV
jgi:predicted transposase YbfD/YdcC